MIFSKPFTARVTYKHILLGFETWPMDLKNNVTELMFVFLQDFIYLFFSNAESEFTPFKLRGM